MPTAGILWIRSGAHRRENRGKRAKQTPPTQMSPAGTFIRTAVHCKKYISFLQHSHFVRMNHPNNLTDMPESIYSTSNIKSNIRECDREMILEKILA